MIKKNFFKMVSIDGVKGLFLGAVGAAVSTTPLAGGMKKETMVDMLAGETTDADAEAVTEAPAAQAPAAETTHRADFSVPDSDTAIAHDVVELAEAPELETVITSDVEVAAAIGSETVVVSDVELTETQESEPLIALDVEHVEDLEPETVEVHSTTVIDEEDSIVNETIEGEDIADDDEVGIVELEDIDSFELDADIFTAPTVSAGLPDDIIPYQIDEQVPTATSVDYAMSFKEALETAREEVGEEGVFEWHGNLFATFYEENWDKMSDDEKEAFVGHIQWIDEDGIHFDFMEEPVNVNHVENVDPAGNEETVDYVTVELDDIEEEEEPIEDITLDEINEEDLDSEVEILGFSTGEDEAEEIGMDVDGDDVMFVDISDDTDPGMGIDDIVGAALEPVEPEIINDDTSVDTTTSGDFTLV